MPQIMSIKELKNEKQKMLGWLYQRRGRGMAYNLIITDRADELIDASINYILNSNCYNNTFIV